MSYTPPQFSLQHLDNCDANQLNDPVIVLNFHYPMLDTINLLQYLLLLALGRGKKSHSAVWQSAHERPRLFVMSIARPPSSVFSPRLTLFALFYPFAWTSGNRKWHWPLLIPPITFVKRECGMESHIRRRVVIIFAMPSAWINHSGRLLVECCSQP